MHLNEFVLFFYRREVDLIFENSLRIFSFRRVPPVLDDYLRCIVKCSLLFWEETNSLKFFLPKDAEGLFFTIVDSFFNS